MKYKILIINPGCIFDCFFCDNDGKHYKVDKRDLIKELNKYKKQKVTHVEILGNDPSEYPHLIEIIKHAKKLKMYVILTSHFFGYDDINKCNEVVEAGVNIARISIYGSNSKIHDSITGYQGSFNSIIKTVKNFLGLNIKVALHSLILQQNKNDLVNIVNLFNKFHQINKNMDSAYFSIPAIPRLKVNKDNSNWYVRYDDLKEPISKLIESAKKLPVRKIFKISNLPQCIVKSKYADNSGWDDVCIKIEKCNNCKVKGCNGFIKNNLENENMENKFNGGAVIIVPGCIMNCKFCNPPHPNDVSLKEIHESESEVLKNIEFFKQNGADNIEISGNDPADYKHLPNLIKYITNQNMKTQLSTHGIQFSDFQRAKELVDNGLGTIRIPIYGITPEQHDTMTGFKNSLMYQKKAIANFLSLGTKIVFHTLITQYNKDHLKELLLMFLQLAEKYSPYKYNCISSISFDIPKIVPDTPISELDYYLPYRDLIPYIRTFHNLVKQLNPTMLEIFDIPHCIIGEESPFVHSIGFEELKNLTGIQLPQESNRSKECESIPDYRIKIKLPSCKKCKMNNTCSGFLKNDIERFGLEESDLKII